MSPCIHFKGATMMVGGPSRKIMIDGKATYFEDHERFGPYPELKGERERKKPFSEREWVGIQAWYDQGKRIGEDGLCLWDEPKKPEKINLDDYVKVRIGRKTAWMKKDVYEREKAKETRAAK